MTFAPPTLLEVRHFFQARYPWITDAELGIAGGPSHVLTGTSYHLGADQLKLTRDPYSVRTGRDKAGLSNAASAFDLPNTLLGKDGELRELSQWVVTQCRANAPDTRDIREVIFSPDGNVVLTWDREKGVTSFPVQRGSLSHRTHTHFSRYRDAEFRPFVGLFKRFYAERGDMALRDEILTIPAETIATGERIPAGTADAESLDAATALAFAVRHAYVARRLVEDVRRIVLALPQQQPITDEQLERVLRKIFRSVPE